MDDQRASADAGDRVGRYVLRERLGAGGMGIVHAAWDPELDRRVAIKLIRRSRAVSPELLRRRLRREAQAMARLQHPNVVAVYDVGESDGQLWVAMEYVDGVNVRKWLQAKPRAVEDIVDVFRAAGEGLAAAHAEGLIHRDFKPDNVLVANDGRVLVLDFGLASWATSPASGAGDSGDSSGAEPTDGSPGWSSGSAGGSGDPDETSLTQTGAVLGTPSYMAPEQQRAHTIDARSDQFAFCVALWQALTGELPYGQEPSRSLARARVGKLGKLQRKGVPVRVERALRRGLAWHPEERWPSMRALLDALASTKRGRWLWAAVPVALLVGVAGVVWGLEDDEVTGRDCAAHSERVSEVWNASVSEDLAQHFAARGELARRTWPFVRLKLEEYATRWVEIDGELCERYGQRGAAQLHEEQLLCLDRGLARFEHALALLEGASAAELERSFDLLARLPDPAACREAAAVIEAPGVEPEQVAEFETAIDRLELEIELGRHELAESSSLELFTATNAPGFEHAHMRVVESRSELLAKLDRRKDAIDVAFSGLSAAERDGTPKLRLWAFINLTETHINTQDLQGTERFLAQAKTIATEPDIDPELQRNLAMAEGWVLGVSGRLDASVLAFDRALALTDPMSDPLEHLRIRIARTHMLGYLGKAKEAFEQLVDIEQKFMNLVGSEHPEVLDLRIEKGEILRRLEDWKGARKEFLDASSSLETLRGQPTTASLAARANAAWMLDRLGDCKGALAEYDPIIPLAREQMPYPSPDLGAVISRRAEICGHRSPAAIDLAREALALYRAAVGDEHVIVASARNQLARTLYEVGELAPAREEVEAALAIYAAIHPVGSEFVDETRALSMLIRHDLGEPNALDRVEEVLATLEKDHSLAKRLAALR